MRFIETLLITNRIENLNYHNYRMNKTREIFFQASSLDLKDFIKLTPNKRVRVLYDEKIIKIEYFDLVVRKFQRFKLVNSDIDYSFKFENREKLNSLKDKNFDEVIIIKNNLVTDTTISNLAFFDGKEWITPKTPLLNGTKRAELIDKGILKEKDIFVKDLNNFSKMAMLNSILGFYQIENFFIKE